MTAAPSAPSRLSVPVGAGRRWLMTVGVLLLVGPLLFDLGYALHPTLPEDAAVALAEVEPVRDRFVVSKVMVAFGGLVLIALLLTLRQRLIPGRGRTLATVASALAAAGLASNSLSQATHGYLMFWASDPEIAPGAGAAILEVADGSTGLAMLPVSFWSVPLFALGLMLFFAALWRAGTVPRWVPVMLVLGGIGGGAIGTGPVMILVLVVDLAAYGAAVMAAAGEAGPVPAEEHNLGMAT